MVAREDHRPGGRDVLDALDRPPHAEVQRGIEERHDAIEDRLHGPVAYAAHGPVPGRARPAGVVIPIRAFRIGKARLAAALDADQRAQLALVMAERVVAAAGTLPVAVVTADAEVREWATAAGIDRRRRPGRGLDGAATAGVA